MKISVLNVKSLGLKMFSLVGFNDTLNTIKGYISVQSKGVYRQRSCQGISKLNLLSSLDF